MYIKRNYGFWMTFNWSKMPFIIGLIYTGAICGILQYFQLKISLPWQPLSMIGIAVAFYLGFKNNSSYDRTWEARKIWGSIVNESRTFGAAVIAFVKGEEEEAIKKELIYRHIAWLITLRYQLRLSKEWEHVNDRLSDIYESTICKSYYQKLDKELIHFLPQEEIKKHDAKTNTATQILKHQAVRLQELRDANYFEDFRHMEFHSLIRSFYADQGKSERIKTFPFPRQYASTALWLTFVFCALVPFGMLDIFLKIEGWMFWVCPAISALVIWIFFLMEKIGDFSENPFEGSFNDVPISSIARTIEIDLREMIDDEGIPEPISPINGFLL